MVSISIETDIRDAQRMLGNLSKRIIPQASMRALNKGIKKGESVAVKKIAEATSIKPQKKIRKFLRIRKAGRGEMESSVKAFPSGLNLIEFLTPGKRKVRAFRKKKGVTANAWGRKKEYKGRFIGTGKSSGKLLVFERTADKAYPIKATYGPSVPKTFLRNTILKAIKSESQATFKREFERQINLKLSRMR